MLRLLDGKKTWIGLVLSGTAQVFTQLALAFDADPGTHPDVKVVVAGAVLAWGAIHKLVKGE